MTKKDNVSSKSAENQSERQTDIDILRKNIESALKAKAWLERSYNKCKGVCGHGPGGVPTESEMDDLEALTSRFARLTDILIHKVYRSLEVTELETPRTLIDTMNRMAKRNLIPSVEEIRLFKDLRNVISHEFEDSDLLELMKECLVKTPDLIQYLDKVVDYCRQRRYL